MRRTPCCVVGWVMCAGLLLAQGCSGAALHELPAADSAAPAIRPAATAAAAASATPTTVDGLLAAETTQPSVASDRPAAADATVRLSLAEGDPFWFTDMYVTFDSDRLADLEDMRVLPAEGEPLGPLRDGPSRVGQHARQPVLNRVFDMCDPDDLLAEARLEGPRSMPTLLFRERIPRMIQQRGLMGCDDPDAQPGDYDPRYALWSVYNISWYHTPEQAREAIASREAAAEERLAHSLPDGELPLGIYSPFHSDVVLPVAEQAVEELRVEPGSVSVIDGVVRGLVRNWSRTMWAYSVSVSVSVGTWHWPLSIQPGEIAPFEIEGWTGEPPEPAQFIVEAEFSPEIDVSRAWFVIASPGLRWHWPHGLRNSGFPAEMYESFPPEEQVLILHGYARAHYSLPNKVAQRLSHPSLADVAHLVAIPDLRGYAALGSSDEPGAIVDVIRIPLYGVYYFPDGTPDVDQVRRIETTRYPIPAVENATHFGGIFQVDWAVHRPEGTGVRGVWAGGAHPPSP
ncbi:hypothetical protein [Candidatus Poriferisodalis sp.]|uniref:hypothetical protein n=1 Tax=Candidatus Poriferisodalis sp. TaxID=3101277 RepID=UPI003B0243F4